ncbi:RNA-directed DNA polymerase [Burkholderia metallica]|uniref:antiviral reverse transcriptase Drt3b n=1 Tax=Burkholderia metallica TaxID=488729 RepID=UPI00157AED82|nr:antiviral reverse transcriptase Drt3b [Burkholderia metallica]NTZ88434.1 RNA-directed DNA polymerase [Burkholderia metallica]
MYKNTQAKFVFRPLVTETLPYEVPVIFSNDKFYNALSTAGYSEDLSKALSKLYQPLRSHSKPYSYSVKKDSTRTTQLSIMHPLWQIEVCNFYAAHEGSILSHCAKSKFSLRRPVALATVYAEGPLEEKGTTPKSGIADDSVGENSPDTAHFTSYFAYSKYTLLSKFYESSEFIRLEKRFRFMRSLDVSKCFYHIYTHSVSWAVKSKEFAKENINSYSFEGRFDKLMQISNYNETNGILVGPELSRIFAEIIFQKIDYDIQARLSGKNLIEGRDYSIRRYVDDFSVFSNSIENLDLIQRVVAVELGEMKLYLNERKIATFERPFVTPLTLARTELSSILASLDDLLSEDKRTRHTILRNSLRDARSCVVQHKIEFANVSGWLLSTLTRLIQKANARYLAAPSSVAADVWVQSTCVVLEFAFHLCALDLRVRSTYNICQLINAMRKVKAHIPDDHFEEVEHRLSEELIELISGFDSRNEGDDSVELFNILICGAHFIGSTFAKNSVVRAVMRRVALSGMTYFKFVTLTFCYLTDRDYFSGDVIELNDWALGRLADGVDFKKDAEKFLLLSDFLGSPLVENKVKRKVFDKLFGGSIGTATMDQLASIVGFSEWRMLSVDHLLRRKELRPVYAMA